MDESNRILILNDGLKKEIEQLKNEHQSEHLEKSCIINEEMKKLKTEKNYLNKNFQWILSENGKLSLIIAQLISEKKSLTENFKFK